VNEEAGMKEAEIADMYHRHIDTIYKVCFMLLRDRSDTEDAVQTVFMKLMQSRKTFSDHEHEKAWLIRTAQNYCKNVLFHWWRRKKVSADRLPEPAIPIREDLQEVWRLALDLPAKYKTVVYLFYYEGYSSKEIARMLEINESTIRSRLRTARHLLKLNLETEGEEALCEQKT